MRQLRSLVLDSVFHSVVATEGNQLLPLVYSPINQISSSCSCSRFLLLLLLLLCYNTKDCGMMEDNNKVRKKSSSDEWRQVQA